MIPHFPPSLAILLSTVTSVVPLSATKLISFQPMAAGATVYHPAVLVTVTEDVHNTVPAMLLHLHPGCRLCPTWYPISLLWTISRSRFCPLVVPRLLSPTLTVSVPSSPDMSVSVAVAGDIHDAASHNVAAHSHWLLSAP